MPNISSFGAQTDNAVVQGTVTDRQMIIPEVPPQGLMSVGPRVTPNFVKEPWSKLRSYNFFDVVKDVAGSSYIAIKPAVPANTELTDEEFWFKWSDPDAQLNELQEIVKTYNERISQNTSAIAAKAPTNHASEESIYGVGNELNYGHVRLAADDTPMTSDANMGIAATPKTVKSNISKIVITPEMFGAVGDGVANDTNALIAAIKAASKKNVTLFLAGSYNIASDIVIDNDSAPNGLNVEGASNTTFSIDNIPTSTTTIKLNSNKIIVSGVSNVYMRGVSITGSETGIKINGYRSKIIECAFSGFQTAISLVNEGASFAGENVIDSCLFLTCAVAINSGYVSDNYIIGNIFHGTCTKSMTGSFTSNIISANHDYSSQGATIGGALFEITGNYIDNCTLTITSALSFKITNNFFIVTEKSTPFSCIKLTQNNISNFDIQANSVFNHVGTDVNNNLTFVDISQCKFLINGKIINNNTATCANIFKNDTPYPTSKIYTTQVDFKLNFSVSNTGMTLESAIGNVTGATGTGIAKVKTTVTGEKLIGGWTPVGDNWIHEVIFMRSDKSVISTAKLYSISQQVNANIPSGTDTIVIKSTVIRENTGSTL